MVVTLAQMMRGKGSHTSGPMVEIYREQIFQTETTKNPLYFINPITKPDNAALITLGPGSRNSLYRNQAIK